MNYPALRWVASTDCKVEGSARAVLWVVAYHADRDTGDCWVGQRRIAQASGLARSTVQLALDRLFADCILEPVEDRRGPKPERFRIAPSLVEGEAFGSGLVEGTTTATGMVEGQAAVGEVIHNPGASGPAVGPQPGTAAWLLDRSWPPSGPIQGSEAALVDRFTAASGPTAEQANNALTSTKSQMSESQGYKQGSSTSREEQVLDDASSAAGAAGVVEAPAPPPSVLAELERRGLRPSPRSAPKPEPPPRSREEQLAILERQIAEDEAKAKNGQEGKESA